MATNIRQVSEFNLDEVIRGENLSILDFWADWCGPCKALAPILEEIAQEYEGKLIIGTLNVDKYPTMTTNFGIKSIPTLLFFKGEELVGKHVGAIGKQELIEKINKLL